MIRIFIGLCAVLAVIMIVIGGIEYMTSELVSSKEQGKEKIQGALLGLLIAVGAYALLNTINPDLLNTNVKIDPEVIKVDLEIAENDSRPQNCPTGQRCGGRDMFGADWGAVAGEAPTTLPSFVSVNRTGDC